MGFQIAFRRTTRNQLRISSLCLRLLPNSLQSNNPSNFYLSHLDKRVLIVAGITLVISINSGTTIIFFNISSCSTTN